MKIISRKEWGARAPLSVSKTSWSKRSEFIVHHSAGPRDQAVKSIQSFHMDEREWSDVGYNFLVDAEGRVFEGRGWLGVGAHAVGHNTSGVGVCFIGNDDPTPEAKKAIRWLYDEACRMAKKKLKALGHCDVNSTACPGGRLHSWVKDGMAVPAPEKKGKADMKLPVLKPGDRGYHVKTVRWLLGARGYAPDNLTSFDFDNKLGLKVNEFKKAKGLQANMVWDDAAWKAALLQ